MRAPAFMNWATCDALNRVLVSESSSSSRCDFRYTAMARRSSGARCCRLSRITSDMGPNAARPRATPCFRNSTMSSASLFDPREGAYPLSIRLTPPPLTLCRTPANAPRGRWPSRHAPAPRAALRGAGGAVAQALDEVCAAVPFGALVGVGLEYPLPEIERAPSREERPPVVWKAHLVRPVLLRHRRERLQIRVHRVGVLARHLGVGPIWKGGIEERAVLRLAVVQRVPEIVGRPRAESGLGIGRDVRAVERPVRSGDGAAAGVGLA